MQAPLIPKDEAERIQALRDHGLLDTPAEERFDRITRLAQQMFDCQIALVSLVDSNRQWFKSRQGLDACETGRDISFCGHAILGTDIFHIADARLDLRFADNPLVTGPLNIRFYAGAPLKTSAGHTIGTLCIIDPRPRQLTPNELTALRDLADCAEAEINRRQQARQHDALLTLAKITSLAATDPQLMLRNALALGCHYLGLPFGVISRIHGDNYDVQVQISPPETLSDGQHFSLAQSFCSITINNDDVLSINQVAHSEYAHHPCYQTVGLESYIGVALRVNDTLYGTLNFSSPKPRSPRHFTEAEIEFVRLLGRWVMTTMQRWQLERIKSEFVSTVSHELRSPLTSISGALGLLTGGVLGALPEKAQEMTRIALKNSQRLTFLINDLLDMDKLTAGKMQFDMQSHSLLTLVTQALEANQTYSAERNVKLVLTSATIDANVLVDSQRLMQVMSNLLSNAIKYSPDNSTVDIALKNTDTSVRVSVTDHGTGIPAKFHDRIFQKFAQADSSDSRQKSGTGLGLAITRELIEHMGGQIGFNSTEGMGASFSFGLPIQTKNTDSTFITQHDNPEMP